MVLGRNAEEQLRQFRESSADQREFLSKVAARMDEHYEELWHMREELERSYQSQVHEEPTWAITRAVNTVLDNNATGLRGLDPAVRDAAARGLIEGTLKPTDIPQLRRLAADPNLRPVVESVFSRPRMEGVDYAALLNNLQNAHYPDAVQHNLNFMISDGTFPPQRLARLLADNPAGLRTFLEQHAGMLDSMRSLRTQMGESHWHLLSRNLSRLRDVLVGASPAGAGQPNRQPNLNKLNGLQANEIVDNLRARVHDVRSGNNIQALPGDVQVLVGNLGESLRRYARNSHNDPSLNEVFDCLTALMPHRAALQAGSPELAQAVDRAYTGMGPLPAAQMHLNRSLASPEALRQAAPHL